MSNKKESWLIKNTPPGGHFYTDKEDKHMTALSFYQKIPIKTERVLAITYTNGRPEASHITKVTIKN